VYVAELWRYPVKSLSGEPLTRAELTAHGIVGDRVVHIRNARSHVVTARTKPRLLALRGTWDATRGEPLIDGREWQSPEAAAAVRDAVGEEAILVRDESLERFDVLPLLVATDGAIAELGVDRRRLRPNIVIAGVEGLAEREWPGRKLRVGETIISVAEVRERCVMTTYDPDTQVQDLSVLRRIVKQFGGRMALDCDVIQEGRLAIGDPVDVLCGEL
jgi:uncharacterized protein YcbX